MLVKVNQYFTALEYFCLPLAEQKTGDENMQCCSRHVSGTYPKAWGVTRASLLTLQKSYGGWWDILLQGGLCSSLYLSTSKSYADPIPLLVQSSQFPLLEGKEEYSLYHTNISRNLGREQLICYILQYVCFYQVRLYFPFRLTLQGQVPRSLDRYFPTISCP